MQFLVTMMSESFLFEAHDQIPIYINAAASVS